MEKNCLLIDFDELELEETCPTCRGNKAAACSQCKGLGTVLTIIGEKVIKLVRKYFEKAPA